MKLKKISLLFFLTFFFVSYLSSSRNCLVNIGSKFSVVIEGLTEDAKKIGLTKERLRTVTELRLRKEGMIITGPSDDPDIPVVSVNVNVVNTAFNVELCIKELIEIQRKSSPVLCIVVTWGVGRTGTHGNDSEFVVFSLSKCLDRFLNNYYKANPKKEVE